MKTTKQRRNAGARSMVRGTSFTIKLAGVPVAVTALFPETKEFCRDYLTDEPSVFSVEIIPPDILFEREKAAHEDALEGIPARHFSDQYLETLAVYRKIAFGLLDHHTLLFHGSAIAVDGSGYLFTAKSGTGKSTHTRLWREYFGNRAVMVNDDKPLLKFTDSGVFVCGTPWDGKHHLSSNLSIPLKAVCILTRSRENQIRPITQKEAWPMLMQQSYRPSDAKKLASTLSLVERLGKSVELYQLGCNMERSAAKAAYDGMNSKI